MIAGHGFASALSDLPAAGRPAGAAWPLLSVQGRRVAGAPPRGRRAAQKQPETSPGLGRPGLCSPRWSGCCPRGCEHTGWLPRARSCAHRGLLRRRHTPPASFAPATPGMPADRWTWLLLIAYTRLRLARDLTADLRR